MEGCGKGRSFSFEKKQRGNQRSWVICFRSHSPGAKEAPGSQASWCPIKG